MRIVYPIIIAIALASCAFGQAAQTAKPAFDITDFNKKFEVVEWLVEYDNVAWKTTDVVTAMPKGELERMGQEWFCFQDKNKIWHAVYGRLTNGKYEIAVHLEMDANQKITRSTQKLDAEFLNLHGLALKTGREKLAAALPDGGPRFNQYIRQNPDKTFSVWLFPAFQPNRMTVFGGEAIYLVDATGRKILKDESYFQKDFRGFKSEPPREIWLDYVEMEKPSLGAIFFVWYYRSYFTQIFIDNARSTTTAIKTPNGYLWAHVEKDGQKPNVDKDDPSKPVEKDEPRPKLERKKPGGN
jgi:hypothetical protein